MTPDETVRRAALYLNAGAAPVDQLAGALTLDAIRALLPPLLEFLGDADKQSVISMLAGREVTWWTIETPPKRRDATGYLIPGYVRELRKDAVSSCEEDFQQTLADMGYRAVKIRVRWAP